MFYMASYMSGGAGFLPSAVSLPKIRFHKHQHLGNFKNVGVFKDTYTGYERQDPEKPRLFWAWESLDF